jgi:hypothetical protein
MAKKKYTKNRRQKRNRRRTMKGGAFSQQELQHLQTFGFDEFQIESLTALGVSFNEVTQKINNLMNEEVDGFHGNSDTITEQVMVELFNEYIFENPVENQTNQQVDNLDQLNTNNIDGIISGYTTSESDDEIGGMRRRKITKKRRGKKTRKQRGGMCFGNGVGANSNDPNYSVYNTNMLKIFPYKTN